MSENGVIGGLTIDFNLPEAYSLEFTLLSERRRDEDLEDPRGMLFQPVAAEKPSFFHIQHPIDDPEAIGRKEAQQRSGIVGTESQRSHRFENPMDLAEAERSFRYRIDAVNAVEREQDIVKALIVKHQLTGIHDSKIDSLHQITGGLYHLRNDIDPRNGMAHPFKEKACSPATTADIKDCSGLSEMPVEDPLFHGEQIGLTVLLQSLLMRKGFFIPHFLLGEIHQSLFPVLGVGSIVQDLSDFHKEFVGTHDPYRVEIAVTWRIGFKVQEVIA